MTVLGWVLVILGLLFIVVGLVEAVKKLVSTPPRTDSGQIDWWALIQALLKAGLFNVAVGIALLLLGLRILGVDIFPEEATTASE